MAYQHKVGQQFQPNCGDYESDMDVNRNKTAQCSSTVSIPRDTVVKEYSSKIVVLLTPSLYNQSLSTAYFGRYQGQMPLNPPRTFILRAHALELFLSAASITIGIFVWVTMKDSNSGVNLLAGAALVVAGIILLASAMQTILKY
jgi:hypothetical protein